MTRTLWKTAAVGAALTLAAGTASAAPSSASTTSPAADVDEAPTVDPQALFREGEQAYWLGDFDLAIERFEAAYAASRLPGMLYNVGLAYSRRYDLSRSIVDLERARVVLQNYLQADVAGLVAPAHVQGLLDEIDAKIAAVRAVEAAPAEAPAETPIEAPPPEACVDAPEPAPRGPSRSGAALVGLGAASLTGGVVASIAFSFKAREFADTFALLDRQRSEAGCTTPASSQLCTNLDESLQITARNGHRADILTATVGGSLLAVGAGLSIAGAVLLAKRRRSADRNQGLALAPTWGGVTLLGRF